MEGWEKVVLEKMSAFSALCNLQNIGFVIVNDGSASNLRDAFAAIFAAMPSVIIIEYEKNKGKGFALRKGVEAIEAATYMITDIDFPYTLESMMAISKTIQNGTGLIAAGNRNYNYYDNINSARSKISRLLRYFIRLLLNISIDDTQCGLKAFHASVKPLFLAVKTNRYLFDLELIVRAEKAKNISIVPVPVELRKGISLSRLPAFIIFQELGNFIRIILMRRF